MKYLSEFYDKFILPQKPQVVTDQEISLIQTFAAPGTKILDLGCGSGRHLIPLSKIGYEVVGIEKNTELAETLVGNYSEANLIIGDISSSEFINKILISYQNNFNLIILMWNAVNEMAYALSDLQQLIQNLEQLINSDGKIIIQADQSVLSNPLLLSFTTTHTEPNGDRYVYESRIYRWVDENRISICNEKLTVESNGSQKVYEGQVTQRWWSKAELEACSKKVVVI